MLHKKGSQKAMNLLDVIIILAIAALIILVIRYQFKGAKTGGACNNCRERNRCLHHDEHCIKQ